MLKTKINTQCVSGTFLGEELVVAESDESDAERRLLEPWINLSLTNLISSELELKKHSTIKFR